MDDKFATVIEGRFARKEADSEPAEYQAFSFGRVGIRPQLTLLLRKANGEVEGFPYADFRGISAVNEDVGFTIRFDTRTVKVEGQNLKQLFQYVCNYRAAEIVEAEPSVVMQTPDGQAVVWSIFWQLPS